MQQLYQRWTQFFLNTTIWMYFTIILLVSYALMQVSGKLGWLIYLALIGGLTVICVPVFFMLGTQKWTGKKTYWSKLAVLVVWPISLFFLGLKLNQFLLFDSLFDPTSFANEFGFLIPFFLFVLLEFALVILQSKRLKRWQQEWLKRASIFKLAAVFMAIITAMLVTASTGFQEEVRGLALIQIMTTFLSAWAQLFIIYFSYYLIYHIHHHFLFNQLLQKKGIVHYLLGAVGMILLLTPFYNELIRLFPVVKAYKLHSTGLFENVFNDIHYAFPISVFTLSLPFIGLVEWYKKNTTITALQKEKSETELSLLKQQINPHFFFNTLNNLYSMSLTKDEKTPETILQLSDLMRYVIYKGKEKSVLLKDEIQYLKDYIDLQRIRLHKQLDYQFEVDQDDLTVEVAPLLFIILVENAFKHGIEPAERACFLHLKLVANEEKIQFICQNSVETPSLETSSGIGLTNLKRRLELLYPNQYDLELASNDSTYKAILTLKRK